VDQVRLLDSVSIDFIGRQKVIEQAITAEVAQQRSNGEVMSLSQPTFDIRIRPSGEVSDIILKGTTLDIFFAMISGIALLFWFLFHCLAKKYNHYKVRSYLANKVYSENEQYESNNPF
jgi:hypothetical protein